VIQEKSGCSLEYIVKDAFGNQIFKIRGPQNGDCCCGIWMIGSVAFTIVSLDSKTIVGGIGKLWGGFAREIFTMADNYGLSVPPDLDVTTKAILLGAVIMLVNNINMFMFKYIKLIIPYVLIFSYYV